MKNKSWCCLLKKDYVLSLVIALLIILIISYTINVTSKYEKDIDANEIKTLRVGILPNFKPYCYISDTQTYQGFNIDVLNTIALKYGFNVEFYVIPEHEIMTYLVTDRVDCVLGMDYGYIPKDYIESSVSFFDTKMSIFVKKDNYDIKEIKDLASKRISMQREDPYINKLEDFGNTRIFKADDVDTSLKMLSYGIVDAYVGDKYVSIDYINSDEYSDKIKIILEEDCDWMSSMIFLKQDIELVEIINAGFEKISSDGTLDYVKRKWFGQSVKNKIEIQKFISYLLIISVFFSLAMGIVARINRILKKEVEQRTNDINKEKNLKEAIIDSLMEGLIFIDLNNNIYSENYSALKIMEEDSSILNKNLFDLKNSLLFERDHIEQAKNKRIKFVQLESKLTRDGNSKYIQYNITPVLDNNKLIGLTISFKDITEEKNMMKKIINKDKLESVGRLTAGIAHEIRNPLTSINMYIKLLPEKIDNIIFREQILEDMPKEIKRLNNIIKNLLDYASPNKANKTLLNLYDELGFVLRFLRSQLKDNNIELITNIDKNIDIVFDAQQFKQIIINIVINAIDALKNVNNPQIIISAYKDDSNVCLEICDNGKGISEEEYRNIFEPFFTTKEEGYGLGLSIVTQLVKENNSEIFVDDKYINGAKFIISVPCKT